MDCQHCGSPLDRPGDYCLVCRQANADTVVLDLGRDRSTITTLDDDDVLAERTVTTTPETDDRHVSAELRSYAGQIADDIRRKRPDEVYATGDREVLREVRSQVHYSFYRINGENPVEAVIERRGEPALEVVEASVAEKLGGTHSTLIGGRTGRKVLALVAEHPHVKKIIPGPIDAGGSGSRTGLRAKVTRADDNGNVRLLVRDGSSVQENRVVTTAGNRELGERVRDDINDALTDSEFQD